LGNLKGCQHTEPGTAQATPAGLQGLPVAENILQISPCFELFIIDPDHGFRINRLCESTQDIWLIFTIVLRPTASGCAPLAGQ
jgi:hypothetical protein